ncbi:MAG: polysaccharide lyase, partial [Oscillospiraceae bacterium]|nr:polysaccharide lyase [Oscillospiraceae bacterium]
TPQQTTTAATQSQQSSNVDLGGIKVVSAGGWNEMLYVVYSGVKDADVTGVSYSGAVSGTLTGDDLTYLVRDTSAGLRVDIPGVPAGTYSVSLTTAKGTIIQSGLEVNAQDRSGYAHYNYTDGVGAYNDNGTLKSGAIVLYVTNDNKDTVSVTSKDGTKVTGIGNILNSAGQDIGGGKTSNGGTKPNSNAGIIKKLAEDGTPLVVRIIGDVKAPAGLTAYDSTDFGGSVGDNGYMARMRSGKDVTIEGIGTDAVVDGWGFHFIAESAAPTLGKSFEIRNIAFRNVPEDCVGMEGVQEGSKLTASVERCWVHNCEFYKPTISNPAESDKAGGDGACDFKRGQYFTNSYCYYEGYHKTNLVGASDSNLQFHLTYHHNYWNKCESRGPLARQANIHMYNNMFIGQTSYCMNPRANAYIFSEYNYFENCKNPMQVKLGAVKSYNDVLNGCKGDQQGTVVTDKSAKVNTDCQYANFDTNASICYIPSGDYFLQTDTSQLASYFEKFGGTMDETTVALGTTSTDGTAQTAATEATTTSTTTTTTTQTGSLPGDVDADGKVGVSDVIMMQKYLLGLGKLTDPAQADLHKDGVIDIFDLAMLKHIALNH